MLKEDIILIIALAIIHVINSQSVDVTVQDVTVILGEDASISCSYTISGGSLLGWSWTNSTSTGDPLNVLITSDTTPAPDSRYSVDTSQVDITTLIISNTLKSDEGFYRCSVIRDVGFFTNSDFGTLTVQFSQSVDVTVQEDATVILGEDASISCSYTISGGGLLGWSWTNSTSTGDPLDILISSDTTPAPDSRYSVDTSQVDVVTLIISNTLKSDEGFYRCSVIRDVGFFTTSDFDRLTVQLIETVTINIINSHVTEGDIVTFVCSVNANPVSTIILYKDETEVTRETTTHLIYNINSVTRSDGGNYRCEAINRAGTGTSQIEELDVQYPPEFVDYINVAPGENVVIVPDVSANPNDITYKWTTDPHGIDDIDTNPATFTFSASEVVGTNYIVTVNATNIIESATKSVKVTVSSVEYCASNPCENEGTCIPANFEFTCECKPGYSGRYCENEVSTCSSSTSLIIGMFFVGIIVGAFGVIGGSIGYTRVKQKAQIDKRSTDKRKQDTYMDYKVDRPTAGSENQTYQDLQPREEEAAYVNVKPGKR